MPDSPEKQRKDSDYCDQLIRDAEPHIKRKLRALCHDAAVVHDVSQETLISLLKACRNGFRPKSAKAIAMTHARWRLFDYKRQQPRQHQSLALAETAAAVSDDAFRRATTIADLKEAMPSCLSFEEQNVLAAYLERRTWAEIAEKTGLAVITARRRFETAISKLRKFRTNE